MAQDLSANGNQRLNDAMREHRLEESLRLLEEGADPNLPDLNGNTPLRRALDLVSRLPATDKERRFGRKMLPQLIRHGADPERRIPALDRTHTEHARQIGVDRELAKMMRRHGGKPRQADD